MQIIKNLLIVLISSLFLLVIPKITAFSEEPVHSGYPFVFDATGRLDRISEKKLVIDDTLFKLSSSTTYHAPDTVFMNPSAFNAKDFVGVLLKNRETREIISVWLIEKAD